MNCDKQKLDKLVKKREDLSYEIGMLGMKMEGKIFARQSEIPEIKEKWSNLLYIRDQVNLDISECVKEIKNSQK